MERLRRVDRPVEREVGREDRRRDEAHAELHVPQHIIRIAAHDAADGHAHFMSIAAQLGDTINNARRVSASHGCVQRPDEGARVAAR